MNILTWLNTLRPAIPMSMEHPGKPMSNSELRRHLQQGGVLINGEKAEWNEELDFPVISLVFFPKSESRRTTIW